MTERSQGHGLNPKRTADREFCRWAAHLAGRRGPLDEEGRAFPELQARTSPPLRLRDWRQLASQLRSVVEWQLRILVGFLLADEKTSDEVGKHLEKLVPHLACSVDLAKLLIRVAAHPMLCSRDFRRYREQDRKLSRRLAMLGKQKFLWARGWAETAVMRLGREAPIRRETLEQELKINAHLLRGVECTLRMRGVSLTEHLLVGSSLTYGIDFDRLLPAILLTEHFTERTGRPHYNLVAGLLYEASRWEGQLAGRRRIREALADVFAGKKPKVSREAVRKAVTRVPQAKRRAVYELYFALHQRERRARDVDPISRTTTKGRATARMEQERRQAREFVATRMRFFEEAPRGSGVSV